MLKPGGGAAADGLPPGTKDVAPGLKLKLAALGFKPEPFWDSSPVGLAGSGVAISSHESPISTVFLLSDLASTKSRASPFQQPGPVKHAAAQSTAVAKFTAAVAHLQRRVT